MSFPWALSWDDSSSSSSEDDFGMIFDAWVAQWMEEDRIIENMLQHMLTKEYYSIKKRQEANKKKGSSSRRKGVKKDLPTGGGVVKAIEGNGPSRATPSRLNKPSSSTASSCNSSQPSMCLRCGVPMIYSYYHPLGMVCPTCPLNAKKKGSTVKDKGKSKRLKAQSSNVSSG